MSRSSDDAGSGVEDLLPAVRQGDVEAFDRWYRSEHPRVWRLCLGFLADAEEAADLTQDAMLHLHRHLEEWDPARSWEAWRNAVVVNLCRDRLRRIETRRRAEHRAAEQNLPATLPHPAQEAERGELAGVISEALGSLSPREREAFVLCELEGSGTAEAARVLDIGESSVRSLLTLARRRLRQLLAHRLPDLGPPAGATAGGIHG